MRVGLISDTHDFFDAAIPRCFAGVDHILHAGDVGRPWVILELEQIASVVVVRGNADDNLTWPETAVIELAQRKFLVHHIVDPLRPSRTVRDRVLRENPDVVVFGHTHQRYCATHEGTLYVNPGYAGKPRPDQVRTVAILEGDATGITVDYVEL
jgi:hypothetical protein